MAEWNAEFAGKADALPDPVPPLGSAILYATDYGVVADGVTSDDAAMKRAIDAASAAGTRLWLPPGRILMNGTGSQSIILANCAIYGTGQMGPGTPNEMQTGTTILLTSTNIQPFIMRKGWSMSGITFYWPNQLTGLTPYPWLMAPDATLTATSQWYLDHVTIINAYNGIRLEGGPFIITNCIMYATNVMFQVTSIGDQFRIGDTEFTPGPWFSSVSGNAAQAAMSAVTDQNIIFRMMGGGINAVNLMLSNVGAFAWRYAIVVESGVTVGISKFDWTLDGVGTVLEVKSGGIWGPGVVMSGSDITYHVDYADPANRGNKPAFLMNGTGGSLDLQDWHHSGVGTFVESNVTNVSLRDVTANSIGSIADGGDYYAVHVIGNPGGQTVFVQDCQFGGQVSSADVHGIKTDVVATRLIVQDSAFFFFNDVMDVQAAPTTIITGNWSINTNGSASVLISGANTPTIDNNRFDKPLKAVVASGFGTSPSVANGSDFTAFSVNVGTGGAASSGIITMPVAAPHGYACSAVNTTNPASFVTVGTPTSATTITLTNYSRTTGLLIAWTASDVISVSCEPY